MASSRGGDGAAGGASGPLRESGDFDFGLGGGQGQGCDGAGRGPGTPPPQLPQQVSVRWPVTWPRGVSHSARGLRELGWPRPMMPASSPDNLHSRRLFLTPPWCPHTRLPLHPRGPQVGQLEFGARGSSLHGRTSPTPHPIPRNPCSGPHAPGHVNHGMCPWSLTGLRGHPWVQTRAVWTRLSRDL